MAQYPLAPASLSALAKQKGDASLVLRTDKEGIPTPGYWHGRHENEIEVYSGASSNFLSTKPWGTVKAEIEERIRDIVSVKYSFLRPDKLEQLLENRIYGFPIAPRMMNWDELRDQLLPELCRAHPTALAYFADCIADRFLGGSYSMLNRDIMVGVGEMLSVQALHENLPDIYKQLFSDTVPEDLKEILIEARQAKGIRALFRNSIGMQDLPALVRLCDRFRHETTYRVPARHWDRFSDRFEGIAYTSITMNIDHTFDMERPKNDIDREWINQNAVMIGTVKDLLQSGAIQWPETPARNWKESMKTWLTSTFTATGRAAQEKRLDHATGIAEIMIRNGGIPRLNGPA